MKEGKLKVHECLRSVSASGNVVWSIVWEPDEDSFLVKGCRITFFRLRDRLEETNDQCLERLIL